MAIAYFPSLRETDTVEVTFDKLSGGSLALRLAVDSGFMGISCFVLPDHAVDLAQASAPSSQAKGALAGTQKRVLVSCRLDALAVQLSATAILADISMFALPTQIQGIAGLRFLRCFRRWGAEKTTKGAWRFFLET